MINVSRWTVRWTFLLVLVLVGSLQVGCKSSGIQTANLGSADPGGTQFASTGSIPDTNNVAVPRDVAVPKGLDLLQVGDSMTIEFTDLPVPVTSREERIKEDGTVSLMEGKTFVAAGKTRGQLKRRFTTFTSHGTT